MRMRLTSIDAIKCLGARAMTVGTPSWHCKILALSALSNCSTILIQHIIQMLNKLRVLIGGI